MQFQQELEERTRDYFSTHGRHLDTVVKESRIKYNPAAIDCDKWNIEFDVNNEMNDDTDLLFFNSLLNDELRLRNIPLHGSLEDR